jgi:phenylpyruvate tautomerase PptA (4-oxalocrotonate tautomerase family)
MKKDLMVKKWRKNPVPLIEMTFGKDALTPEQKTNLSLKVQETKQPRDYTWVIIHEEPMENWLIGSLTMQELKVKLQQQKK